MPYIMHNGKELWKTSAGPGETCDPCAGCGKHAKNPDDEKFDAFFTRPKNGLCRDCQQLLDEGRNARERRDAQSEHKLYWLETRYLGLPHLHASTTYHYGDKHPEKASPNYVYLEHLWRLAQSMAEPLPTEGKGPQTLLTHLPKEYSGGSARGVQVWLTEEQAEHLRMLDYAVRRMVNEVAEACVAEGVNILKGLATGRVDIDKFNEISAKGRKGEQR